MKIRILFREIRSVPVENRQKQAELEHRSDLACVRLGLPLPMRMRPFTGNMDSRIRISEREYDSIAEFTRLYMVCEREKNGKLFQKSGKTAANGKEEKFCMLTILGIR